MFSFRFLIVSSLHNLFVFLIEEENRSSSFSFSSPKTMPPKPSAPSSSPAANLNERRLDIGSLPPRELVALRDQLEGESRSLAQRAMALQQVAAQFGGSGRAIERLAEQKKGM